MKPAMLKEAAQNAGAKVGKIRSANQGGFVVEDAGSGNGGSSSVTKEVRVVTTIDFYLTDRTGQRSVWRGLTPPCPNPQSSALACHPTAT